MKYVRFNKVDAEPMTRGDYNKLRGWTIPANENPADDGYVITYRKGQPDEYVSWCPKAEFDAASISCADGGVPFCHAIAECQYHGKKIRRAGWNGDGQYVHFETVLVFEDGKLHIDEENAGPAVESACFVFHFKNRHTGETGVQVGWLASQGDMKANDWIVF